MNYSEIFEVRGSAYDRAMRRLPDARAEEFLQPLALAAPRPGERLLDMPAGGGYMRRYLPDGVEYVSYEPSVGFGAAGGDLVRTGFAKASFDVCVSIAGVHHIADKRPLFAEWARVLKPGGRLVLVDVEVGSAPSAFLDGCVDRHTATGHKGDYLDAQAGDDLAAAGFTAVRAARLAYPWRFASRPEAVGFCKQLFGLYDDTADAAVEAALADTVGFCDLAGGGVGVNWALLGFTAQRPA